MKTKQPISKKGYWDGEGARFAMLNMLGSWQVSGRYIGFTMDEHDSIRKEYTQARDSAIAFGEDVSEFPKTLKQGCRHERSLKRYIYL